MSGNTGAPGSGAPKRPPMKVFAPKAPKQPVQPFGKGAGKGLKGKPPSSSSAGADMDALFADAQKEREAAAARERAQMYSEQNSSRAGSSALHPGLNKDGSLRIGGPARGGNAGMAGVGATKKREIVSHHDPSARQNEKSVGSKKLLGGPTMGIGASSSGAFGGVAAMLGGSTSTSTRGANGNGNGKKEDDTRALMPASHQKGASRQLEDVSRYEPGDGVNLNRPITLPFINEEFSDVWGDEGKLSQHDEIGSHLKSKEELEAKMKSKSFPKREGRTGPTLVEEPPTHGRGWGRGDAVAVVPPSDTDEEPLEKRMERRVPRKKRWKVQRGIHRYVNPVFSTVEERPDATDEQLAAKVEAEMKMRSNNPASAAPATGTCSGATPLKIANTKNFIFIQTPHLLPAPKTLHRRTSTEDGTDPDVAATENTAPITPMCCPTGEIGELRLHKSGKMTMKLGDLLFEIDHGRSKCQQELLAVFPTSDDAFNLGPMEHMLTVRPQL